MNFNTLISIIFVAGVAAWIVPFNSGALFLCFTWIPAIFMAPYKTLYSAIQENPLFFYIIIFLFILLYGASKIFQHGFEVEVLYLILDRLIFLIIMAGFLAWRKTLYRAMTGK